MKHRLRALLIPGLMVGLTIGLVGSALGQDAKGSIPALFEGLPAELRTNIRSNSVRIDRVNDWLAENVNGKDKTIDIELPVVAYANRDADKTYAVQFYGRFRNGSPGGTGRAPTMPTEVLGDTWSVQFSNRLNELAFIGVSTAEAEKVVGLKQVHVQAKVTRAYVNTQDGIGGGISLLLEDVQIDGKKWTPRLAKGKVKGSGKGGP